MIDQPSTPSPSASSSSSSSSSTEPVLRAGPPLHAEVRRFRLTIIAGEVEARAWESVTSRCSIGSDPSNDLPIDDPTVSRFHCDLYVEDDQVRVIDLNSKNSTIVDGVRVHDAYLRNGALIQLGATTVRFTAGALTHRIPTSTRSTFGRLVGHSIAMRAVFALLERAAATPSTILLEGETGTGKGAAAEAVHGASGRASGPFVVVDCGAVPAALLESELFGHERGAFTSADVRRIGAFEEASGGTIFLDEIGELPLELQPKLLRVLENREIRRVGGNSHRAVDVWIVAATNRDLRAEVNAGRFRSDLYFRLAVLRIVLPPLRQRREDVVIIAHNILTRLEIDRGQIGQILNVEYIAALERMAWPGNVRELRNALERRVAFADAEPDESLPTVVAAGASAIEITESRYEAARSQTLAAFERAFVASLLARHDGNVTKAAEAAGIGRVHFHRLMRRHGVRQQVR